MFENVNMRKHFSKCTYVMFKSKRPLTTVIKLFESENGLKYTNELKKFIAV